MKVSGQLRASAALPTGNDLHTFNSKLGSARAGLDAVWQKKAFVSLTNGPPIPLSYSP
jgi:hypothetical protein